MSARTAARLAWSLWGLEVAGILLWLPNHAELVGRFGTAGDGAPHVFLVPGYATVGAVIAARSRNRIGWLFLTFGLAAALLTFAFPYHLARWRLVPACPKPSAPQRRLGRVRAAPDHLPVPSSLRTTRLVGGWLLRSVLCGRVNAAPEAAE